jgi:hypothetical protein
MLAPILTLAIALLFTLAAAVAMLTIIDSALKARRSYAVLMREAALLRSGFALQIEARDVRVRRIALGATLVRYAALPLPACAAA